MAKNTVIVSVLGDTKGLQRSLTGATSSFGKFAKGAAVATAAITAGVAALGTKAVKSASELQQNIGAMQSVFKDSAGQMEKWESAAA